MNERECELTGYVLARVELKSTYTIDTIASIYVKCPAVYKHDWQIDGGFRHDEGGYYYDIDNSEPIDSSEFSIIKPNGVAVENENERLKIVKILEIFSEDLSE